MRKSLLSMGVPVSDMTWVSGIMGVPITFMDKYNPEQFEILGHEHDIFGNGGEGIQGGQFEVHKGNLYKRILICPKRRDA